MIVLLGCGPLLDPPETSAPAPLEVGETREIVLHSPRLDIRDFRLVLDRDDLTALPDAILDEVGVLDLPLGPLVSEVLDRLATLPDDARARLDAPSANLQRLLTVTPDTLPLDDTSLAGLQALAPAVGIPIARPLADLLEVGVTEPILPPFAVAPVLTTGLVASHPAAPDGALPISLFDLLRGFPDLAETLGPADTPLGLHPGFLDTADDIRIIDEAFAVTLRATGNALPYGGIDLTDA
ncbi:MAG: hypothetical protein AAF602_15620, partial [Myxococcota bacterium]